MENVMYEAALKVLTEELANAKNDNQIERLNNAIAFLNKEYGIVDATE